MFLSKANNLLTLLANYFFFVITFPCESTLNQNAFPLGSTINFVAIFSLFTQWLILVGTYHIDMIWLQHYLHTYVNSIHLLIY